MRAPDAVSLIPLPPAPSGVFFVPAEGDEVNGRVMEARLLLPEDGRAYAALRAGELETQAAGTTSPALVLELGRLARQPSNVIRDYYATHTVIWGAFDRDLLVGTLAATRRSSTRLAHYLWLWGLFVRPPYRGTPASRVLITAALDLCERQPLEWRLFGSFDAPNVRAYRFCERYGFAPIAEDAAALDLPCPAGDIVVERPRGS